MLKRTWPTLYLSLLLLTFSQLTSAKVNLPDFTQLVEEAAPAVVNISTTQKVSRQGSRGLPPEIPEIFRHFFGELPEVFPSQPQPKQQERHSLGSGFIISADGYLLTNNHVIADADEILVRLSDKRELAAEVIGSDPASDLALLKINATNLPVAKLANNNNLKVGEWVLAIGSPFGFDHSVTAGIVSATGRSLPKETYVPFIQTDVAINPGNSGGPLFNLQGEVVGINSQIYTRSGGFMGLSFAIPTQVALEVVEQLKSQGKVSRGWLGVVIQDVDRDLAESFGLKQATGALVANLDPTGPAAKGGMQAGDIILKVNKHTIHTSSQLPQVVGRLKPQSTNSFTVLRAGKQLTLKIKLGERPSDELAANAPNSNPNKQQNPLGLTVEELTASQKQQLKSEEGLLVTSVNPEGPAALAGIMRGDLLLSLNNQAITSLSQFNQLVKSLPKNKKLPLRLMRKGNSRFVAIEISN